MTLQAKRVAASVSVAVVVVAVIALVLWPKGAPRKETEVRILYPKIVASLPHFVAVKKGIYEKHHLVVKAGPIRSSPDMIDAVQTGRCDFLPAVSLVDAVNVALDQESPLLAILSHSRMKKDVPFESLLVTAGSRLASLRELEGKTVGVFPGGTSQAAVKWYLKGLGIKIERITFATVPPKEQIDTLLAGKVDAIHAYEPERTLGILQYKCRQLSPSIYAAISEPASIGCTGIATRMLREDPEGAKQLIAVWDEAVDFIRTNEEASRDILAEELSYSREVARACTWVDVTKSTELDTAALERFIGVLRDMQPAQVRQGRLPPSFFYAAR